MTVYCESVDYWIKILYNTTYIHKSKYIRTWGILGPQHVNRGFTMDITDIRVRKINKEGKMKAVVSVTFDNEFVVHDIKVIEGDKGRFIAMPSRKTLDGEFRDIAHPINSMTRDRIQKAVLEKYEMILISEENVAQDEVAANQEEE